MTYAFCDIGDRYISHTNTTRNEARLEVIVDSLPACISYIDAGLRYCFVNQTYESWFQISRRDIYGRHLWEVIGKAAYQKVKPYIERVFEGRQVAYEAVLPYAQGHRHVRGTLIPDFDSHSQVQGYYALIVDISDYKHIETQLRRSEAALTKAQEIAHIGSWEFDVATETMECSAEMLRLFGFDSPTVSPTLSQLAQFFPPEDWEHVRQAARHLIDGGNPQSFKGHIRLPNGELRYLEGSGEAIKNSQGEIVKLLGTAMDVTEHKQRIDQLRLLESVILHANDAVLITEADFIDLPGPRIIYANPAFTAMSGYSIEEVMGQTPRILQGPKTDRDQLDQVRLALQKGHQIRVELINYRKDGSEFWVEVDLVPVANAEGRVTHFVAFQRDVSDRKRDEQTLREQAELIDIATDAFLVRDLDGRLLFWSRGAKQIYGWQAEEAIGQTVDQLLKPEPSQRVQSAWQSVLSRGEWQGEFFKFTKAGEKRTIESRWTLVRNSDGTPQAVLSVDTDVTERKQLEAQFFRAQRLESLGTLASGIAHDLNNILTPILGVAQILPRKLPDADQSALELIATLAQSAKRGAALSKQILAFAQGPSSDFTALNIHYLLAEVKRFVQKTFPKSITIQVDVPKDLWMLMGDATHLYQVLMNLCVNARDAMPNGGVLSLSAKNIHIDETDTRSQLDIKSGSYVIITVTDTGVGMPPELIEKIFDPFFTTKEPGKGTGLGLSTVASIVKSHEGHLQVVSQVNGGTRFSVSLPAAPIKSPSSEDAVALPLGSGELILVVDDEPQIRYVTEALLESHNYRVLTASDGAEAIAVYEAHADEINGVLMDMRMPNMSGEVALAALQHINPQLRAVMTSGVIAIDELSNRKDLTVHAFLPKPYAVEDLLQALKQALSA
ncbi:PAS domain S-box protein [Oscillatoria sp. CS-180]|uniref:PAS domain-containing hybrid sensor histidine kinase/response regulator n=1 Tax=Oscillatoria sp. CS-180 TaxID=3021720 RepID=UPI00232F0AE5|nr:PAS domain S-box protein [Oscillatoria sp. CS-180]MDB9527316.1 PAS domain S-box protein [Oscillatoria sp. CS-180]